MRLDPAHELRNTASKNRFLDGFDWDRLQGLLTEPPRELEATRRPLCFGGREALPLIRLSGGLSEELPETRDDPLRFR